MPARRALPIFLFACMTAQLAAGQTVAPATAQPAAVGAVQAATTATTATLREALRTPNDFDPFTTATMDLQTTGTARLVLEWAQRRVAAGETIEDPVRQHAVISVAAFLGDRQLLEALKKQGVSLEVYAPELHVTPLHTLALNDHAPGVKLLLEAGASPNPEPSVSGSSPLYDSISNEFLEVSRALLEGGADPNNAEEVFGFTPLLATALEGEVELARLLFAHGADPNIGSLTGVRPLHLAVSLEHLPMVELLLQNGADPNLPTNEGRTPLDVARDRGNAEAVKLLTAHGAKPAE